MTLLYDRRYNLTIGLPEEIPSIGFFAPAGTFKDPLKDDFTQATWQPVADWRTSTTKNAVLITDMQISANIKGTANSSAPTGGTTTIKVLNLSQQTRDIVERVNNYIILEAGYEQDEALPILFSGQIETVYTEREGMDLVTTINCKEGYSPNNSIKISKSFKKDQTYGDVIAFLANAYAQNGVPTGEIVDDWGESTSASRTNLSIQPDNRKILASRANPEDYVQLPVMLARPANTKLINGFSAMGFLHQVLDQVCSQIGFVSYITNGRLFIHPKGFTRTIEEFQFSSRQMKSIRNIASKAAGSSVGQGTDGIRITTFLDGRLDIDKRIRITDGTHAGTYKVTEKSHSLDFEGAKWDTTVVLKKDF